MKEGEKERIEKKERERKKEKERKREREKKKRELKRKSCLASFALLRGAETFSDLLDRKKNIDSLFSLIKSLKSISS